MTIASSKPRSAFGCSGTALIVLRSAARWGAVTPLTGCASDSPASLISCSARLCGASPSTTEIRRLRDMALKSRRRRASSVCASRAGFRSIASRTPDRPSGRRLESVSVSGPEMPKCVNSISPISSNSFFSFLPPVSHADRRTFFSESPDSAPGQLSAVSMAVSAGSGLTTAWPVSAAMRWPSPVEPVLG